MNENQTQDLVAKHLQRAAEELFAASMNTHGDPALVARLTQLYNAVTAERKGWELEMKAGDWR